MGHTLEYVQGVIQRYIQERNLNDAGQGFKIGYSNLRIIQGRMQNEGRGSLKLRKDETLDDLCVSVEYLVDMPPSIRLSRYEDVRFFYRAIPQVKAGPARVEMPKDKKRREGFGRVINFEERSSKYQKKRR